MNYDKEFKDEALKLSDEIGIKKAAEQLDLHYYTIADWRKSRKAQRLKAISPLSEVEMKIRMLNLKKKLQSLSVPMIY